MNYIKDHFATTGKVIRLEDVPDTMYGGALPVAKSRKTKRKALTKDEYLVEASEPAPKKPKKAKATNPEVLSLQQEAQDLADTQASLSQSSIPKKKRKMAIRKLRQASLAAEEEEEAATSHDKRDYEEESQGSSCAKST